MTLQDVFDAGLLSIRRQGRAGVNAYPRCSYRTPEGLKCVAGHLIRDDEYDPSMEGHSITQLALFGYLPARLTFAMPLIASMQDAHDQSFGDAYKAKCLATFLATFEARMRAVAERFELIYTPVSAVQEAADMALVQALNHEPDWITRNPRWLAELVANVCLADASANGKMFVGPPMMHKSINHPAPRRPAAQDVLVQDLQVTT